MRKQLRCRHSLVTSDDDENDKHNTTDETEIPSGEAKHSLNESWLLTPSSSPGRQIATRSSDCIPTAISIAHFRPRRQRRLWETN